MSEIITLYTTNNNCQIIKVCFNKQILEHYIFPCILIYEKVRKFIHNDGGPAIVWYQTKLIKSTFHANLFDTKENLQIPNLLDEEITREQYQYNGTFVGQDLKAYSKEDLIPHLNKLILS